MAFLVGKPGEPYRLYSENSEQITLMQLQAGECCVPVDAPGAYHISADGLCAIPADASMADVEGEWLLIRHRRNQLLTECDWTQLPDVAEQTRLAWVPYRQALRDLTDAASPADVVWPTMPDAGEQA